MRYGESAVRGRLFIDMDDMHPLEFPKEFEVEGDLLFSSVMVLHYFLFVSNNGGWGWIDLMEEERAGDVRESREPKLLGIDDIVSGIKKKQPHGAKAPSKPQVETEGDADNEQIIFD
ncbi:hypothetical protein GBA52_013522 [Prunus armeniaca]|nr:hypothetical protein GBA52_013522 [Prunus armeniaca]